MPLQPCTSIAGRRACANRARSGTSRSSAGPTPARGGHQRCSPVPERWTLKKAGVHLRYTVSANLIPESSTLVVKMRKQGS